MRGTLEGVLWWEGLGGAWGGGGVDGMLHLSTVGWGGVLLEGWGRGSRGYVTPLHLCQSTRYATCSGWGEVGWGVTGRVGCGG